MTRSVEVHVAGVSRYCPTCGRWLVTVHPEGTFDLAAKASAVASGELDADVVNEGHADFLLVDATCLRWPCRVRRWVRR